MSGRGRIVDVVISRPITFNEELYTKARIEIDHVNYGLDTKTKELNKIRRSHLSIADVCQFILELDGVELVAGQKDKELFFYALEMFCPVDGNDFGKRFRLIFTTTKNDPGVIGTITLFRVR